MVLPPGTRGGASTTTHVDEEEGSEVLPKQNGAPLPESGDIHRGAGDGAATSYTLIRLAEVKNAQDRQGVPEGASRRVWEDV